MSSSASAVAAVSAFLCCMAIVWLLPGTPGVTIESIPPALTISVLASIWVLLVLLFQVVAEDLRARRDGGD